MAIHNVPAGGGGGGGSPSGPAGGVLAGEYPNPALAAAAVANAAIAGEAVDESKLAAAVRLLLLGSERVIEGDLTSSVRAKLLEALTWRPVEAFNASMANAGEPWGNVECAVDQLGLVHMRGASKVSAELAAKAILFTLPAACHPEKRKTAVLSMNVTSTTTNLVIFPTGEVETLVALKTTGVFDFDQVTFTLKG